MKHLLKISAKVGMEPSGGTLSAYLSDLKQAGLIQVESGWIAANKDTLLL